MKSTMKTISLVSRTCTLHRRPVLPCNKTVRLQRWASTSTSKGLTDFKSDKGSASQGKQEKIEKLKKVHKSMAEADEEMRRAMENLAGDGGEAGVELEEGKAVAMKRGVRENMFRYI
ncbi:hypothetical protein ABEF95_004090 [Exophiala dermatitidis]